MKALPWHPLTFPEPSVPVVVLENLQASLLSPTVEAETQGWGSVIWGRWLTV